MNGTLERGMSNSRREVDGARADLIRPSGEERPRDVSRNRPSCLSIICQIVVESSARVAKMWVRTFYGFIRLFARFQKVEFEGNKEIIKMKRFQAGIPYEPHNPSEFEAEFQPFRVPTNDCAPD